VDGPLDANGSHPVQARSLSVPLAVKPTNIQRLGFDSLSIAGQAPAVQCSEHQLILCNDCCYDFTILNLLIKHLVKGKILSLGDIETITKVYFAQKGSNKSRF
jgi:hypothetical protein